MTDFVQDPRIVDNTELSIRTWQTHSDASLCLAKHWIHLILRFKINLSKLFYLASG